MKKRILFSVAALFMTIICFSQTQTEMNETAQKDFIKADKIMAATYKAAMVSMDQNGKKLLLEAQRAWIKYKETHCKSVSNQYEGGSMQPLVYYSCLTEVTDERTAKLKAYTEEK